MTLTIDDDIARLVEEEAKRSGESFEATLNRLLRLGLAASAVAQAEKRFVVEPIESGVGEMLNRHDGKVSALLEELEGPYHR